MTQQLGLPRLVSGARAGAERLSSASTRDDFPYFILLVTHYANITLKSRVCLTGVLKRVLSDTSSRRLNK